MQLDRNPTYFLPSTLKQIMIRFHILNLHCWNNVIAYFKDQVVFIPDCSEKDAIICCLTTESIPTELVASALGTTEGKAKGAAATVGWSDERFVKMTQRQKVDKIEKNK